MIRLAITAAAPLIAAIAVLSLLFGGFHNLTQATGLEPVHDKLGWMDDSPMTDADWDRVAVVAGLGKKSDLDVIGAIQRNERASVTGRDFELLRQDRRRAQAAYPDVKADDLIGGTWLDVDISDRVPASYCTSGNSNGTTIHGKDYLDGGCYVGVVLPGFQKRADTTATKAFFAAKKVAERQAELDQLRKYGPSMGGGGTGGSFIIHLDKATNMVVVEQADEWASTGHRWTIPFVPEEWLDVWSMDAVKKVPSFAHAKEEDIKVTPSWLSIGNVGQPMFGSGGGGGSYTYPNRELNDSQRPTQPCQQGMLLMPGQSCQAGVSIQTMTPTVGK